MAGQRQLKEGGSGGCACPALLLKQPRLLLLDEATSALDALTESKARTAIVDARCLATIRNADRILVIDQGRIVETGTPDELLKLGGLFSHLYKAQSFDLPAIAL